MPTTFASTRRTSQRSRREEGGAVYDVWAGHKSVMPKEALEALALEQGDLVVDATAGEGGHSYDILHANRSIALIALDADKAAVETTEERLKSFGERVVVVESNFADLARVLKKQGIKTINKALFDLGWNSGQLASGRGFSFLLDEPLNMSYGKKPASGFTASEIVNGWDESTLSNVFFGYGEERYAHRIAKAIVTRRKLQPLATTMELVELIKDAVPPAYRHGRIHPATRTFQALRIAVNDELGVMEKGIAAAWEHLVPKGRLVVITFHSIEDRLVKRLFVAYAKEGSGRLVTKKPLVPTQSELAHNPRARSAKLRTIEKI